MLARFCGVQRKYRRLRQNTTTAIACKTGSCVATQAGGDAPPQVGGLPFWVFSVAIIWRRDDSGGLRFSSDLDQKRAVLWSKSEMKHPKHLEHLEHFLWMFGL